MNLTVRPVDVEHVHRVWPLVEHYIIDALNKGVTEDSRNYNVEHVQVFVTNGTWLLVVVTDEQNEIHGCATISFLNYPLHRVAFITAIGGRLISNPSTFEQFKEILKRHGATKIQGMGRNAIVRLWSHFGFKPGNTVVELKL